MDSLFKCSACGNTLQDPLLLPCGHNICRNCAETSSVNDVLACPACGAEAIVSEAPTNAMLATMIASMAGTPPAPTPAPAPAAPAPAPVRPPVRPARGEIPAPAGTEWRGDKLYCLDHGKEIDLFDFSVHRLICSHCALFGGEIGSSEAGAARRCLPIFQAMDELRPDLQGRQERQKAQSEAYTAKTEHLRQLQRELKEGAHDAAEQIEEEFRAATQALEERRNKLLSDLATIKTSLSTEYSAMLAVCAAGKTRADHEVAVRANLADSNNPLLILPLVGMPHTTADESDAELASIVPDTRTRIRAAFAPHLRQECAAHGMLHRLQQLPTGDTTFTVLGPKQLDLLTTRIDSGRRRLGELVQYISERARIADETFRALRRFSDLRPLRPDPCAPALTRAAAALGEAADREEGVAAAAAARQTRQLCADAMLYSSTVETALNALINELHSATADALVAGRVVRARRTEAETLARELVQLSTMVNPPARVLRRLEQATEQYQGLREQYKTAVFGYRAAAEAAETRLRGLVSRAEELERGREQYIRTLLTRICEIDAMEAAGASHAALRVLGQLEGHTLDAGVAGVVNEVRSVHRSRLGQPVADASILAEVLLACGSEPLPRIPYDPTGATECIITEEEEWADVHALARAQAAARQAAAEAAAAHSAQAAEEQAAAQAAAEAEAAAAEAEAAAAYQAELAAFQEQQRLYEEQMAEYNRQMAEYEASLAAQAAEAAEAADEAEGGASYVFERPEMPTDSFAQQSYGNIILEEEVVEQEQAVVEVVGAAYAYTEHVEEHSVQEIAHEPSPVRQPSPLRVMTPVPAPAPRQPSPEPVVEAEPEVICETTYMEEVVVVREPTPVRQPSPAPVPAREPTPVRELTPAPAAPTPAPAPAAEPTPTTTPVREATPTPAQAAAARFGASGAAAQQANLAAAAIARRKAAMAAKPEPTPEPAREPTPVRQASPAPAPVTPAAEPTPVATPVREPTPTPAPVREPTPMREPTPAPAAPTPAPVATPAPAAEPTPTTTPVREATPTPAQAAAARFGASGAAAQQANLAAAAIARRKAAMAVKPEPTPVLPSSVFVVEPVVGPDGAPLVLALYGVVGGDADTYTVDCGEGVHAQVPVSATMQVERARRAKAVYDFDAQEEGELQLEVGDELYVISGDEDWSKCVNVNTNDAGDVPTSYIQIVA